MTAPTISGVNDIHSIFEKKYLLRDMGDLTDYLGLQITLDCTCGLLFVQSSQVCRKDSSKVPSFRLFACELTCSVHGDADA